MDYQQLIDTLSPEIYQSLNRSLEVGKWPDGKPLTAEQRHNTMAAIITWGEKHLPEKERVGYIDKGHKAGGSCDDPEETTLNWKE
ncbi:MAG: DUF1315 domain-containing protein [Gammaproteobacteria bacterium]|nr:MAG: DUF1315 domain-containing protein [Gammaproteobacteria bacterium]RLA60788.1 MAG: DUF1315 domain-containing protein [Gammaproteobacteria bacterium]